MRPERLNATSICIGIIFTAIGLTWCLVPEVHNDYRRLMRWAIRDEAVAIVALTVPLLRGPARYRWLALILMSPAIFIVFEWAERGG